MNYCIKRELYNENKDKPKIPRPPNAFMLYANENRKKMSQLYPTESNKDISKRLGNGWKCLDEEERKKFFEKARIIGLQHKKVYPDYVYNPKEARIRKAMRDATRERSPMLSRPPPVRRSSSHSWLSPHDDLIMSPLGMRAGGMEGPVCGFPLPASESDQFMGGINSYGKLERTPLPAATTSVHTNYMQTSPLAQLQQQTEMWPDYPSAMRARSSSGNPFMLGEVTPYSSTQQTDITPPIMMKKPPSTIPNERSILSDNSNENDTVSQNERDFQTNREVIEPREDFMTAFGHSDVEAQTPFDKVEDNKIKNKNNLRFRDLQLPLSSQNFRASPSLFSNDVRYQNNYVLEYFQNMPSMTLMNITTPSGISFPYATYSPTNLSEGINNEIRVFESYTEPCFFATDVGYVPMSSI